MYPPIISWTSFGLRHKQTTMSGARGFVHHNTLICAILKLHDSGAQTVASGPHAARKALWSGPRGNFHWKENLTLYSFKRIF